MDLHERALLHITWRECVDLISDMAVGRVVFTERAMPAVLPVTFAVVGDAVVFSTGAGTRLAEQARRGVLCFQVDEVDVLTRTGWSVLVTGVPEIVTDETERAHVRELVQTWVPGRDDVFVRLPFTVVTGRRIVGAPAAPAVAG
jgi:nitroimidazol reductase NimA-like FMN-containing flavoprotein (pyridoxamine 5'-phosphate oxidase superfamily)